MGQRLAEGLEFDFPSLRLSNKQGRRQALVQQGERGEGKLEEKEMTKPGSSENPPSGPHGVTGKPDSTRSDSSAGILFDVDDVDAAAAMLTRITDICKHAREPSIQEQEQLRDIFNRMPYLLTPEGRRQQGEELVSALQFLVTVYDNPESTNWGTIESFDHLQLVLEELEKFGRLAEAEPREGPRGVFIL